MRFEAKHGMSRTRLYKVWTNMRDRCNRVTDKEYKHYGGKGIKVCDELELLEKQGQEPKTGHWIPSHIPESILDECSECGFSCGAFTFNYCPNCGAKMVEPQEGSEKE